jgi:hypothetical protein
VDEFMSTADLDGDGKLNYHEFVKIMTSVWAANSGWPDWANFRPFRICFLFGSFFSFYKQPNFLCFLFRQKKFCINLAKMGWATPGAIFSDSTVVK